MRSEKDEEGSPARLAGGERSATTRSWRVQTGDMGG
jgi:hypothetical protein